MQLTDEFEIVLRNVAQDLNRHTGKSKFYLESANIVTYSQGQILTAEFTQLNSSESSKFSYVITLDKGDGDVVLGPFEYDDAIRCSEHIYSLIISKLGDKVVASLLK